MLLAVDFPAAEAQSFAVGQAAQVMPDTTFEVLNGTIRSVSGADPSGDASLMTCTVTIAVPNTGSLTTAQAAVAQVNGVSSLNSAHFAYQREETVVAAASGTVSELCVREGSTVRQDDVLLRITGKDLDKQAQNAADNLRSAELRMSSAERNISHYTIDAPISRDETSAVRRMVRPDGQQAVSHYEVLSQRDGLSFVKLQPETGRTHQLRVHMAHIGCPLAGDWLYGTEDPDLISRPALHAYALALTHPVTGTHLYFTAPIPADMEKLI